MNEFSSNQSFMISECSSSLADEALLPLAATSGPVAAIWTAPQELVVPRSYQKHTTFEHACQISAAHGWPVRVRNSGGGIVPQGQGILNLSLCWPQEGKPLDHSSMAYQKICHFIEKALLEFDIATAAKPVESSFCDGRFNLAIDDETGATRKIAGTAQLWRRIPVVNGEPVQVVLVHSVLLVHVDCIQVNDAINRFEQALETDIRYRADRIASLHTLTALNLSKLHWNINLVEAMRRQIIGFDLSTIN